MVGFIQHASARFIALESPADGHSYELTLNVPRCEDKILRCQLRCSFPPSCPWAVASCKLRPGFQEPIEMLSVRWSTSPL